jgi:acyl-coenzyme A thioesterase PaaI-like protein
VTSGSGELRAEGRVTKPGRRVAFADATVVDGAGRIVATATGSCLVFPQ